MFPSGGDSIQVRGSIFPIQYFYTNENIASLEISSSCLINLHSLWRVDSLHSFNSDIFTDRVLHPLSEGQLVTLSQLKHSRGSSSLSPRRVDSLHYLDSDIVTDRILHPLSEDRLIILSRLGHSHGAISSKGHPIQLSRFRRDYRPSSLSVLELIYFFKWPCWVSRVAPLDQLTSLKSISLVWLYIYLTSGSPQVWHCGQIYGKVPSSSKLD